MRYRKSSEKYLREDRKNEMFKLYDEQDKKLINEMIRDYKTFHSTSVVAVIWLIAMVGLVIYSVI